MTSIARTTSNTVDTLVSHAQISNIDGGFVKSVDKAYADVGDSIQYSIIIKNTGNTNANNVVLTDTIPSGTSFVKGSVTINGVSQASANPQTGINIGSVAAGQTQTVIFSVIINTIPSIDPIPNSANIAYTYTSDPSIPNGQSGSSTSNTVTTKVNNGSINPANGGFVKSVNKSYADVNDTLTYTIVAKNSGNISINNVVITDTIPQGTTFVPGSVVINGVSQGGASPQSGINVGTIASGGTATITFNVTVVTIPATNPAINQAAISYAYTVNPANPDSKTGKAISNTTSTQINSANFGSSNKTVNPIYADLNSVVTYTVALKNTGNVAATNVTFFDTIPNGTTLVPNSVTINGIQSPGTDPSKGVNVGSVLAAGVTNISFSVLVNTIPSPNPIINQGSITYNYTVDPSNPNGASGSSSTSQTQNTINSALLNPANGSISKSADKTYVTIGDTINYTLKVNNQGNVPINNLFVLDTIPNALTFTNGSIVVNGTSQPGANIKTGVSVGSVSPGQSINVLFAAVVNTVPIGGIISNNFVANYNYTVNPAQVNGVSQSTVSNNSIVNVNDAVIGVGKNSFLKVASKAYADIGDVITYTITLSNTGNVAGNNVVLTDPIPNGTSLVANSLTVNGIASNQSPQNGINIGSINAGSTVVIKFQVNVNAVPNPNPISNVASLSYTYTKDPSNPNGEQVTGTSTPAITKINHGNVPQGGFTKYGDKTVVKRGDTITYTVTIPNTGNVTITNVVFTDTVPTGTVFVPNSVVVNGTSQSGYNPNNGIPLAPIGPNSISNIVFKVLVNSIPNSGVINNQGIISYQYIVDPSLPPIVVNQNTNISKIVVSDANINSNDGGFIKNVDKVYAQLQDTLTYTFTLVNTGNVTATNVIFTDSISNGAIFNKGSVIVNGKSILTDDPRSGISLPPMSPNVTLTLSFKATVVSIPLSGVIPDTGYVNYNFVQDSSKPPTKGYGSSNTVTTAVNSADFSGKNFLKTSSPYYVTLGDTINYSFNINNAGNNPAQNVVFTDSIPDGISFIPNTVYIAGVQAKGADPIKGISLGTLPSNIPISISFNAIVNTLPVPNPAPNKGILSFTTKGNPPAPTISGTATSNIAYNKVNTPNIKIIKSSNPNAVAVGDTLKYKLVVQNNGNVTAQNTVIYDPLAQEISYIPDSLTINGVSIPNGDIVSGVTLGDLSVGEITTLTFNALVLTLPRSGKVANQSNSMYEFIVDPSLPLVEGNTSSNELLVPVYVADLSIQKTANTDIAKLNDVITYTVTITNTGNVPAKNIIFEDIIPKELNYISNSFVLNGQSINGVDLESGINIGSLEPGQLDVISYKTTLVKVCCDGTTTNKAFAKFSYKLSSTSPELTKVVGPASVTINTPSSTFKEFNLDGILVVPCPKLDIEEVNDLSAQVRITNSHVIKTVRGVSDENRRLTGYKLIINGILTQTLEYTANDVIQSVHSAYFERKFSTYIVLPEDFQIGTNVKLNAVAEDVYYKLLNTREVFSNITILIDGSVIC